MGKNPNEDLINTFDPALNQQLIDSIVQARDGERLTKIAAAGEDLIRTHIRESGFLRKIIPPKTITNEELDRVVEHDRPVRIEELETNHKGAVSIPFNVSSDTEFYYGPKGVIEFFTIKTPVFTKNVNELRTYRHDIRKVVTEHALNDIETEEDGNFISLVDRIVGAWDGLGLAGVQQHFKAGDGPGMRPDLMGGLSRDTYVNIKKLLEKQRLKNGVFLMNTATAKEFEKLDRVELGGDMSEAIWKNGLKAIGDAVVGGVPHIYTIKDELVEDNVIYLFTEPSFLGKFYTLEDIKLYVERREDQIKMFAAEVIGCGILNMAGVVKVDLNEGSAS